MAIPKPNSLIFPIFIAFFLLLSSKVDKAKAISFNFTEFSSSSSSITLQGDARILDNGILALTNRQSLLGWSTGRALYTTPITIWDSATGNVASFVTSFSFVVEDIPGNFDKADGLIFFIAPEDTKVPSNSGGGMLGVADENKAFNKFVGVEFDTYENEWDPDSTHIGIDVSSLISLKTVKWNRFSGSLEKVSIIYDSLTKTLSVAVTHGNGRISTVSQVVDLRSVLPEKVKVGFSAATSSGGRQGHDLHSWSFTSTSASTGATREKNMNILEATHGFV